MAGLFLGEGLRGGGGANLAEALRPSLRSFLVTLFRIGFRNMAAERSPQKLHCYIVGSEHEDDS